MCSSLFVCSCLEVWDFYLWHTDTEIRSSAFDRFFIIIIINIVRLFYSVIVLLFLENGFRRTLLSNSVSLLNYLTQNTTGWEQSDHWPLYLAQHLACPVSPAALSPVTSANHWALAPQLTLLFPWLLSQAVPWLCMAAGWGVLGEGRWA